MSTPQVEAVAKLLAEWNPLGDAAKKITDLDGYRVEAADIVFGLKVRGDSVSPEKHVMDKPSGSSLTFKAALVQPRRSPLFSPRKTSCAIPPPTHPSTRTLRDEAAQRR
jgi:hypothetical protein